MKKVHDCMLADFQSKVISSKNVQQFLNASNMFFSFYDGALKRIMLNFV